MRLAAPRSPRRGLAGGAAAVAVVALTATVASPAQGLPAAAAPAAELTASRVGDPPLHRAGTIVRDTEAAARAWDAWPCYTLSRYSDPNHARQVLAGRLTIPGFDPVRIGTGDIDWSIDPYRHPSWAAAFRTLRWLDPLVEEYLRTGDRGYRTRVEQVLRDFVADNPPSDPTPLPQAWNGPSAGTRAEGLMCATRALHTLPLTRTLGTPPWLLDALNAHAAFLAGHWQGAWNHGQRSTRTLHRIGCVVGNPRWTELAAHRMAAAFRPNRLGPAIDATGATNEQAPGYTPFIYRLWRSSAEEAKACHTPVPEVVEERLPRLLDFMAHATMPDGRLTPIGDSYADRTAPAVRGSAAEYAASRGKQGRPPANRVAVFDAGYVFARSGWGRDRPFDEETFYSLRFGPGRQVHGHNDHQAITWSARGRPLLVDSGHTGYEDSAYRRYLRSPAAHNILHVPGARFAQQAPTSLTQRAVHPAWQSFTVSDRAYGTARTRSALFLADPEVAVVLDRMPWAGRRTYEQLWHLDPALTVRRISATRSVAEAPDGTRLWLIQVPIDNQPTATTQVVRGAREPLQGWVSTEMRHRVPAPVVVLRRDEAAPRFLTVAMVADGAAPARAQVSRKREDGSRLLTVQQGRKRIMIEVSRDGTLARR